MTYKFTSDTWQTIKLSLLQKMLEMSGGTKTDLSAMEAIEESLFISPDNSGNYEIAERHIRGHAAKLVDHFHPSDDMGEFFETQNYICDILIDLFECNKI